MREWLIGMHSVVSSLFILIGVYILIRSLMARTKNYEFTSKDDLLSRIFVILLYMQCLIGLVLYFQFHFGTIAPPNGVERSTGSRFWVISHFSVMFFILILAQIGRLFIKSSKTSKGKFSYSLFYYGVSLLVIILSAILTYL